ncbi:glycosyltransferase family 4 protein [Parabacteroides sp. PFB2-10]|uniref:glycosyltransferase family 4 protein n=1 Tax=Parabacteroides sp. PFB2-10 TaxID=1742405 RepID=UPI002474D6C1|nr:glycosyltransferase family 4 protein [Parabacteroides sp. PFB2-10]
MKRYKILITANHCAPGQGSEHGVGWNFFKRISEFHDVILICNEHDYIQGVIDYVNSEEGKKRNIKLFLIKQKIKYNKINRLFPFLYYKDYNKWQKNVFNLVKELINTEEIDIIHHITNITFREPGYLWKLNKPFLWGPIGVLGDEPIRFQSIYNWKEGIKNIIRRITCIYQLRYSKRIKDAANESVACICISKHIEKIVKNQLGAKKTYIIPETGAIITQTPPPPKRMENKPIQLLWSAGFDSRKGILFLIEALRIIKKENDINFNLILVGDGYERKKAINLCEKYSINYEYKGYVPYQEMPKLYYNSHFFFLLSLSDATTTTVFESLTNYCPVIAFNHLSFSEVVDDTCGKKIDLHTKRQISNDIAHYIRHYYYHEDERYLLALGARKKAENYSWERKIEQINNIYNSILN